MKRLLIRLSSLGDVVLASAALSVPRAEGDVWHLAVSREYASLFEGHPRLEAVRPFDRTTGLEGWRRFARELWDAQYDEVVDLHGSLRTRLLRFWFRLWALGSGRKMPVWRRVEKQRLRLYGFFLLKHYWPASLRPRPWVECFARAAGGTGTERPALTHLVSGPVGEAGAGFDGASYVCVMPGSLWAGKRWPAERFAEALKGIPHLPVVLGAESDEASHALARRLGAEGRPFRSGVGKWSLREVAAVLARSRGYLGNDTGLAHLAEAVGVPAYVVYGPTRPEMGFGPWRAESRALEGSLWCRPCGKDGRFCYRPLRRYRCLDVLSAEKVGAGLPLGGPRP
jgi:heptosyltransferase-2